MGVKLTSDGSYWVVEEWIVKDKVTNTVRYVILNTEELVELAKQMKEAGF